MKKLKKGHLLFVEYLNGRVCKVEALRVSEVRTHLNSFELSQFFKIVVKHVGCDSFKIDYSAKDRLLF